MVRKNAFSETYFQPGDEAQFTTAVAALRTPLITELSEDPQFKWGGRVKGADGSTEVLYDGFPSQKEALAFLRQTACPMEVEDADGNPIP